LDLSDDEDDIIDDSDDDEYDYAPTVKEVIYLINIILK